MCNMKDLFYVTFKCHSGTFNTNLFRAAEPFENDMVIWYKCAAQGIFPLHLPMVSQCCLVGKLCSPLWLEPFEIDLVIGSYGVDVTHINHGVSH